MHGAGAGVPGGAFERRFIPHAALPQQCAGVSPSRANAVLTTPARRTSALRLRPRMRGRPIIRNRQDSLMAQRPYIVGNWKMNGTRAMLAEARAIDRAAERLIKVEVALAPPFTLIHATRKEAGADRRRRAGLPRGRRRRAHRRHLRGDAQGRRAPSSSSSATASAAPTTARPTPTSRPRPKPRSPSGLSVIVCVGETEAQRDAGKAEAVVAAQLEGSLPRGEGAAEKVTVAYEPVWAIGTGRTPDGRRRRRDAPLDPRAAGRDLRRGGRAGAHPLRRLGQARQRRRAARARTKSAARWSAAPA